MELKYKKSTGLHDLVWINEDQIFAIIFAHSPFQTVILLTTTKFHIPISDQGITKISLSCYSSWKHLPLGKKEKKNQERILTSRDIQICACKRAICHNPLNKSLFIILSLIKEEIPPPPPSLYKLELPLKVTDLWQYNWFDK